ncbi:MAG: UDP-glucose/GDP-mannose dehydrogenase family protein [Candidatus Omnitrophota bacterium]|nr:MAG: UDP-glucose/GDP-mannose dehydrogenase family protein [Candidatus Omnitrophota bacterium]
MKEVNSISVVGLGKLGLCTASCFAQKYKVIGVDIDRDKIDLINQGKTPISETGLSEMISKYKENLKATTDYRRAILNSQVTFIVVATPSEADGTFSNKQLEVALKQIGAALREKQAYHLVVITSTVMPGTTEHVAKFVLEETSRKKCGKDFGIAYNPEFIALGRVIRDFLNPDFILIGEMSEKDGQILEDIYKNTCENTPRFGRMNLVSAEIAKISLNCYITMKITYANSLASICEKVPGADASVITSAIGLDSRIGKKYLKPGLGYGGPCFPRDNVAFAAFARKVGVKAKLAEMVDEVNRDQVTRIAKIINDLSVGNGPANSSDKKTKEETVIGVLGLSYKPNTHIIEDSQAIDIVQQLINEGYKLTVYDPQAQGLAKSVFGDSVRYTNSSKECMRLADVVLITTPWEEFKDIDLSGCKKDLAVLDCWNLSKDRELGINIRYLGRG